MSHVKIKATKFAINQNRNENIGISDAVCCQESGIHVELIFKSLEQFPKAVYSVDNFVT